MKKKSIVLVLTVCLTVMLFSACNKSGGYDSKISEIRDCIYVGVADGYDVKAVSGEREQNYCVDGVSHGRNEFFIVTLSARLAQAPAYCMEINGVKYEGTMTKHPFNDEYTCEIPVHVHSQSVDVVFTISSNTVNATLQTVNDGSFSSWESALEGAVKELCIAKDFDGEIYVRLIENPVKNDGKYFWYVAFCTSKDDCVSVLISVEDGKIIAKKTA